MLARTPKSMWWEYTEAIIVAVILALFIRTFLFQAFKIPSGSMLDTLLIGDHLLVNKFVYGTKIPFTHTYLFRGNDPEIGDVIVFEFPDNPSLDYVKRIVGVPGDVVEMRNKVLYRNGAPVTEPYIRLTTTHNADRDNFPPVTVPKDKYLVLGDNRDESADSRYWDHPFVERSAIHGKAWRLYWSWSGFSDIRWERIGKAIN